MGCFWAVTKYIKYIELDAFKAKDVFDFAQRNSKSISQEYLEKVLDVSQGLPVFVSLMLSNNLDILSTVTYDKERMNKYLERIIDELDESLHIPMLYIGFLSVTKPIISIKFLKELMGQMPLNCLESLEISSLIEIDRTRQNIKMHKLFVNYICKRFKDATSVIKHIYQYFDNAGLLYEQAYYLIMINNCTNDAVINQAIQSAIKEENFAFLIMIGEHFKRLYDWNFANSYMKKETFLLFLHGYVNGLIGVGNYPAAREVIDICKISARLPESDIQFQFSYTTANLYHLQNNYDEAIASYHILLECTRSTKKFRKYEAKCLWGIAHALRHQGQNLDDAIAYYDEAIKVATTLKRNSEIIKSMREKLIIFLCREDMDNAHILHYEICKKVNHLPRDSYIGTRISCLKTEVNYLISNGGKNLKLQCKLLSRDTLI